MTINFDNACTCLYRLLLLSKIKHIFSHHRPNTTSIPHRRRHPAQCVIPRQVTHICLYPIKPIPFPPPHIPQSREICMKRQCQHTLPIFPLHQRSQNPSPWLPRPRRIRIERRACIDVGIHLQFCKMPQVTQHDERCRPCVSGVKLEHCVSGWVSWCMSYCYARYRHIAVAYRTEFLLRDVCDCA